MTVTNNNKPMDMKQMWQQMEPVPTVTSDLSAMTASESSDERYIYYIVGALFYRYDTYANNWIRLAAPLTTPTVFASLRYSKKGGFFGRVISATSTTLQIAGLNEGIFTGKTIKIISGTGAGQIRTITTCPAPVKADQGFSTAGAQTTYIADSTKKWKYNQWSGYQVRITYGTGQTQTRKVLYNDPTTLYFSDTNYQPIDPFNNAVLFPAPVATAGLQAHFVIESTTLTVPTWDVTPDYTSRFKIESGGIWLFTSATTPFHSIQYYDIAQDIWMTKTTPTGIILAAVASDGTIERMSDITGALDTGTAESGTQYTLTDSGKAWTVDQWRNYSVRITAGTGIGQQRRIICNTDTVLEVNRTWSTNPSNDTVYEIIPDNNKLYLGGNAQAFLMQYDMMADLPVFGSISDDGIANNMCVKYSGIEQSPIAVTSGTRTTTGITAVNATPTAGGTGYLVGDILTVTTGGTNGKVIVEAISAGGVVTSISLLRCGSGYTTGTGKVTSGGTGSSCTIEITTCGTVGLIVTAINHNIKIGESITFYGGNEAAWNTTYTVLGCDALTNLDVAITATSNAAAGATNSATLIVDASKNWVASEHVGKMIQTHLVGVSGAVQPRVITANTSNTITVSTITTALVNGTGRYIITDPNAFGRDEQYKVTDKGNTGHATGGGDTTLIDSSKNWKVNQWAGAKVRIISGVGRDKYMTITSNTSNTLTYASSGVTPDASTHYIIFDTFGTCTGAGSTTTINDTTKLWATNQWTGKRLRITGGAGFGLTASTNEITITSNTATQLTFAAITGFSPDASTQYTILGPPVRGAGIELTWPWGYSNGKYLYYPRGGASNTLDIYDITKETWEYGIFISPWFATFTTGSYYTYDGEDRIYLSPGVATGIVQYVYYLDLPTNKIYGFGSVPNTQLAPVLGTRMEVVTSPTGIKYLYHMRNTGFEMYRAMIFF